MPRVSRKEADQHRVEIIEAASRLIPEHGIDGISVPALMAEAGLTHGAFYGHFASKEALVVAACTAAFEQKRRYYDDLDARRESEGDRVRDVFIKRYLRASHRDAPGEGCPMASLAVDIGRDERKGAIRDAFVTGVSSLLERMTGLLARGKKKAPREEVLATASMLVGALVLSRATEGHPLSEEFLTAARKTLLES
ncbi:MAG TPA: TetR/AcrR family transcriptional regulator [Hyphomicrobium sp.]|nr:TetR/AcrR family transcriptional regulator [Hyphomicrobium sp.]